MMDIAFNDFIISDEREKLQIDRIYEFLHSSYWAKNRTREIMEKSIENSLCFGVYHNNKQIAFARCITDYATIFYLADVIVDDAYRGKGIGKGLMEVILNHNSLKCCSSILKTDDAQEFYAKFGYSRLNSTVMTKPL